MRFKKKGYPFGNNGGDGGSGGKGNLRPRAEISLEPIAAAVATVISLETMTATTGQAGPALGYLLPLEPMTMTTESWTSGNLNP
jgi:hypothetical protein